MGFCAARRFAPQGSLWHGPGRRAVLALACAVVMAGFNAPVRAQTIEEALAAVYQGNPGLESERARQRATEQELARANAGWQPTISLEAEGARVDRRDRPSTTGRDRRDTQTYGARLTQPIFRGFRTINARRRARAQINAGESQLLDVSQSILVEAASVYANVIRARRVHALQRRNVDFLRTELDQRRRRFERGDLSRTDVSQARSRLEEGIASLADAAAERRSVEAEYEAVIGRPPGRLQPPRSLEPVLPNALEETVRRAEAANPALAAARSTQAAAGHQVREVQGELLPTVSLDARYARDINQVEGIDRSDEGFVGLRVDVPLYQAGDVLARVRQATADRARLRFESLDVRNRVRAQAERAWQDRVAANARVRATRRRVDATRATLEGVKIEVGAGERAFFEILDAQRELVSAQVAEAAAIRDLTVSEYTLLAVIGQLRPDAFGIAAAPAYRAARQDDGWITGSTAAPRQAPLRDTAAQADNADNDDGWKAGSVVTTAPALNPAIRTSAKPTPPEPRPVWIPERDHAKAAAKPEAKDGAPLVLPSARLPLRMTLDN